MAVEDVEKTAKKGDEPQVIVQEFRTLSDATTQSSKQEGAIINEDPFGDETGEVKYKTLKWWHAGLLLIAETVSLGILSLPQVMAWVGFVPGVLLIAGLGILATYTGYVIGQMKQKYMGMHSFADAGQMIFGAWGRELFGAMQILILVFIMSAHILTFSVMMNVLTKHATCTIIWTLAGTIISLLLTLPRTLKTQSYLSIFSCISITAAIIVAMAGVGSAKPGVGETHLITPSNMTSFQQGAIGVCNIVVAYSGHVAFFGFISELEQPRDFPKSLALLQTVAITFYITVAVVIYYYAGYSVKSPALSSATPIIRKIAWGIAAPTIIIAGVVNAHIAVKNLYVRIWRNKKDEQGNKVNVMSEKSFRAFGSWLGLCLLVWTVAWIIASAIPVFHQLLGVLGALFCSWISLGLPAIFWLWMNKGMYWMNWKKMALFALNVAILLICCVVCVTGVYGSAYQISRNKGGHAPYSCADNSI